MGRVRRGGQTTPAPGCTQRAWHRRWPAAGSADALATVYPGPGLGPPTRSRAARPRPGRSYPKPRCCPSPHRTPLLAMPTATPTAWVMGSAARALPARERSSAQRAAGEGRAAGAARPARCPAQSSCSPRSWGPVPSPPDGISGSVQLGRGRKGRTRGLPGPCKPWPASGSLLLRPSGSSACRELVVCLGGRQAGWTRSRAQQHNAGKRALPREPGPGFGGPAPLQVGG